MRIKEKMLSEYILRLMQLHTSTRKLRTYNAHTRTFMCTSTLEGPVPQLTSSIKVSMSTCRNVIVHFSQQQKKKPL